MNCTLQIIVWNVDGLVQRKRELNNFLYNEKIDIALISKMNFTPWTVLKIKNDIIYTTLYPSGKAPGGTAIIIKKSIKHFEIEKYSELYIQATTVSVNDGKNYLTVTAIYCPPRDGANEIKFIDFFGKLENKSLSVETTM